MLLKIQNIFIDINTWELLLRNHTEAAIIDAIKEAGLNNKTSLLLDDIQLELVFHKKHHYLGHAITWNRKKYIDFEHTKFYNSIEVFSQTGLTMFREEGFCVSYLVYTCNPKIIIQDNSLYVMDSETGELSLI